MEAIKLNHIKTNVIVNDWKQSIIEVGTLLENDHLITHKYIENMIDTVNEMGPYMVLMPGFALVHSAPCKEVIESSVSLITLVNPVNYQSQNDPVSVVMCLACVDKVSHLEKLQGIAEKLMIDGMIDQISKCQTDLELYNLINS